MSKVIHNFILFTWLIIFWQVGTANSTPSRPLESKDESNNIEDESKLHVHTSKLDVIIENQNKKISYSALEAIAESTETPTNCIEATRSTQKSGVYDIIVPKFSAKPFKVYCNKEVDSGGWTVILRRIDGSVDFNRDWNEYKEGFGNLRGEFFIGLEKLHALTTSETKQDLYFLMESRKGEKKYAKYDEFVIGSEDESYSIKELGNFHGNVPDNFRYHQGQKFSTKDRDNDNFSEMHCAKVCNGGWWYNDCFLVLLTGPYNKTKRIEWAYFDEINQLNPLKHAEMMIRPADANKIGIEN